MKHSKTIVGAGAVVALVLFLFTTRTPPGTAHWADHDPPQSLFTGFPGVSDARVSAEEAFQVRSSCPKISTAVVSEVDAQIRRVRLKGAHLPRVQRVAAVLPDGTLADVMFKRVEQIDLVFPLFCTDCDVFLGFDWKGQTVACRGPGYHLELKSGLPIE